MTEAIRTALADVQAREGVAVLYACESGSRAWGFFSADSDYDVGCTRFRETLAEVWGQRTA